VQVAAIQIYEPLLSLVGAMGILKIFVLIATIALGGAGYLGSSFLLRSRFLQMLRKR